MEPWLKATILSLALVAGVGAGWFGGKRAGLRPSSVWVSAAILVAGSLGGPALTYKLIGPGMWSYILALLTAGIATGFTFRPMGERQGEKEWL